MLFNSSVVQNNPLNIGIFGNMSIFRNIFIFYMYLVCTGIADIYYSLYYEEMNLIVY